MELCMASSIMSFKCTDLIMNQFGSGARTWTRADYVARLLLFTQSEGGLAPSGFLDS